MEKEKPFPVFVDNIDENVKTKDLRKVFARAGLVKEVTIISHYGFVNFRSPDDAVVAIECCNNYILNGKKLKVEASEELDNFLKQREESFELSKAKRRKSVDQNYHYNQHPRPLSKTEENYVKSISPNLHGGVQFQRPNNHFFQHDTQRSSSRSRSEEERVPIKRKLRVQSSSSIGSSSGDLRNIIVHSKKPKIADKVEVKNSASPEPKPVQIKPKEFDNVQELQVGNLLNQVEKSDLEQLLDGYGDIKGVGMFKDHAVVLVECSHDTAQEAIEALDQSYWMDNTINVKFHRIKPENLKKEEERRSRSRSKSKSSRPESSVGEQLSPVSHNTEEKQRSRSSSPVQKQILDQIVYEVWIWSPGIKKDQFTDDMVDQIGEYGTVQDKRWEEKDQSIIVQTLCTVPQIIECLTKLNNDPYPYKEIRAKFPNASDHEASLASLIDNYPFKLHSDTFQPVSSTSPKPATSSIDKKIKTREIWLWTPAINAKKSFLQDMAPIISQYGKVKDQGWKEDELSFVYFNLESSEKQAAKCISETHGLRYKATNVRAKYADGSSDENLYKDQAYAILLRNYDPILIPESYKAKMRMVEIERKSKSPTPEPKAPSPIQKGPIKIVLPSRLVPANRRSSAHEAFDEVLNQEEDLDDNKLAKTLAAASSTMALNPKARVVADAMVIESVGGKIYSVSSKVILIEFRVANSFGNSAQRFARLKPGQMFVDGQRNLGYMTQKLRYPDWPEDIKEIFKLGNEVVMDVRRLSRTEEEEVRELTSEVVFYEASLVWKTTKPSNLIKNQNQPLFKATVIKLWPKWAILQPLIYNGGQNLILMLREEYHSPEAGQDSIQSLLSHIEIGDTLAVLANPKEYLDMVEKGQPLEFFKERTNHLKYETVLAWPVVSEIDPYNVLRKKKQASMAEADELENSSKHVNFLATSNCLNLPLPDAKEATYKKWTGYIEQLNLPGGGVVRLTESTSQSWAPEKQRVYFHRARLHINGPRMESKAILEDEVALGDPVTVDVIANQVDMTTTYMSGTDIFWMALSVKVNTTDRGLTLANRLRAQVSLIKAFYYYYLLVQKNYNLKNNQRLNYYNSLSYFLIVTRLTYLTYSKFPFVFFFAGCRPVSLCYQSLPRKSSVSETTQ